MAGVSGEASALSIASRATQASKVWRALVLGGLGRGTTSAETGFTSAGKVTARRRNGVFSIEPAGRCFRAAASGGFSATVHNADKNPMLTTVRWMRADFPLSDRITLEWPEPIGSGCGVKGPPPRHVRPWP